MAISAEQYWDDFYRVNLSKFINEPSEFLRDKLYKLQKGKVLDIAMGLGSNAVFLAQNGFTTVKGFDVSSVAVEFAKNLAKEVGVNIEANKADLDLTIMPMMEYDTIIMTKFRPAVTRYYSEMIRALKQGGTLLIDSYTVEDLKEIISPDESYRNYYFNSNEILTNLKGMKILYYREDIVGAKHVVQCLAQKPYDKDAVKYGLFDMHSKQVDKGHSQQRQLAEAFFKKKDDK